MVISGTCVYGLKKIAGNVVDKYTFKYMGEKYGHILQIAMYLGLFFYG